MLDVYWKSKNELGYTFHFLKEFNISDKEITIVNVFERDDSEVFLNDHLRENKVDLIAANLEEVLLWHVNDPSEKTFLVHEGERRLRDCITYLIENRGSFIASDKSYFKMCKDVLATEKFMINLVDSCGSDRRKKAIAGWRIIYMFLHSEVKKNDQGIPHT